MTLYEDIVEYQRGNKNAAMHVINKFDPLINKYCRKISYDDVKSEFDISIIELLEKISIRKFDENNEGALVNYISRSIKNKYLDILKRRFQYEKYHMSNYDNEFIENIHIDSSTKNSDDRLYIEWLLSNLTKFQKEVIIDFFLNEKRVSEIARERNISKQSVSNAKRIALKKLHEIYCN